jgi:hypothetical protein
MAPHRYGWEHILYIVIFLAVSITGLIFAKKYAKSEKAQFWVMKGMAIALLVAVIVNRFSVVFSGPSRIISYFTITILLNYQQILNRT